MGRLFTWLGKTISLAWLRATLFWDKCLSFLIINK